MLAIVALAGQIVRRGRALGGVICRVGHRVGHDVFRPGWTDYRKRLLYDTYDVTALLRPGRNVLGAAVQLCALPWLGYVPDDVSSAPAAAVGRLSQRLGVPMGELRDYGARQRRYGG